MFGVSLAEKGEVLIRMKGKNGRRRRARRFPFGTDGTTLDQRARARK